MISSAAVSPETGKKRAMGSELVRVMEPGRVYVEYGPVAMMIAAYGKDAPMTELCTEAVTVVRRALEEVTAQLPELRKPPVEVRAERLSGIPANMLRAVLAVDEPTLTPMAAVAGATADAVADFLQENGAEIAISNIGGDVALRLSPGRTVRLRTVRNLTTGETSEPVLLRAEQGIGGICTSGLGGRSFTRGVADSLTVFAGRAALADALATHLANCSYIDSPRVAATLAGNLDPQSDIAALRVVTAVDTLLPEELLQSREQVLREAGRQRTAGNRFRAEANIQGFCFSFP